MTLLFMDGCAAGDVLTKWASSSGSPTRATASPPVTGSAYYNCGSGDVLKVAFTASSEVFLHARISHGTGSADDYLAFYGDNGATQHISVIMNSSNHIEVRRGTNVGTLLATGATTWATGWVDVQIRVTINDSTGVVQIRCNGLTSNEIDVTGADTKNAGTNTTIDAVSFTRNAGGTAGITDVAIMNTAGSVNNTWPGELIVKTLTPDGNGNTSQLLGSDGNSTDNYLLVDETPLSTADYVGSATSGQGDTYTMTDLTGSPTVLAVQVNAHIGKSDGGAVQAKLRVRSGGTTYATAAKNPPGSGYATVFEVYEQDPATAAAWTVSNVNAVEVGAEVA